MTSARAFLEDELKNLMEISADFARGLSSLASRMRAVRDHLDTLDNLETATARCSDTVDRDTSPIIFQTTRSTSVSPFRFAPRIKMEVEEDINDDEENIPAEESALSPNDPNVSNVTTVADREAGFSEQSSTVSKTPKIIYVMSSAQNADALTDAQTEVKKAVTSTNLNLSNGILSLRILDKKEDKIEHGQQCFSDEDMIYIKQKENCNESSLHNDENHSLSTSGSSSPKILQSSEEDTYISLSKSLDKLRARYNNPYGRMTPEQKREYNRVRQAKYRARMKWARDSHTTVPAKPNKREVKQEEHINQEKQRPLILRNDRQKYTYERRAKN